MRTHQTEHPLTEHPLTEHLLDDSFESSPSLWVRLQAMFLDSMIILILEALAANFLDGFENAPDWLHEGLFFGIWLFYEPLLVAFATTPGQLMKGIRVRKNDHSSQRIGFGSAFLRYLLKISLGWVSVFTMHWDPRKRGLHDLAAGSVVIKKWRPADD